MHKIIFSSDALPERDRIESTSEFVSAFGGKVTLKPLTIEGFHYRIAARELAGLHSTVGRASAMLIDYGGNGLLSDHIAIGLSLSPVGLRYRGEDFDVQPRDAGLCVLELPATFRSEAKSVGRVITVPSEEVFRRLKIKDSAFAPILRGDAPGLQLLRHYVRLLDRDNSFSTPDEEKVFACHVYDLVALVLGANSDAAEQARRGGLRAARLKAAKDFIDAHLLDPDLSDRTVAAHLGVSDRYVRMLFASEGSSCKSYIDGQRLARAYAIISNPVWAGQKIIEIAYRCGFNDITTFNRQFRARYGMTPSDARSRAGQDES